MINVQCESLDFGKSSFGQLHFPYYTADAVFVGGSNTLSTFCIIIIIHNIILDNMNGINTSQPKRSTVT